MYRQIRRWLEANGIPLGKQGGAPATPVAVATPADPIAVAVAPD